MKPPRPASAKDAAQKALYSPTALRGRLPPPEAHLLRLPALRVRPQLSVCVRGAPLCAEEAALRVRGLLARGAGPARRV